MPIQIDLQFQGIKQTIAAFLIPTEKGPVLIETGPHSTFPRLKKGIEQAGYKVRDIQHVLLTHIHLDHAGAAWCFAETGAQIHVHPVGLPHLKSPEKLMASAKRIYQDKMDVLWGEMHPIPAEQLRATEHQSVFRYGGINFEAFHTPGHAIHHIAWKVGEDLFAGDVAGVKIENGPVVPPCPPPDIQVEGWQSSIALLRQLDLKGIHLTHFGRIEQTEQHLDSLEEMLLDWANWMKPQFLQNRPIPEIIPEFQSYTDQQLKALGVSEEGLKQYAAANPAWMSVAGLMRYWKKKLR